jgi:hypothetical protein
MGRSSTSTVRAMFAGGSCRSGTWTAPVAANRLLVGGVMAMAMGLIAVLASLSSFPADGGDIRWQRLPNITAQREPCPCTSPDEFAWPPTGPQRLDRGANLAMKSRFDAVDPWQSRLHAETDSTHRGRLSGNWRNFLMLASMRVHAPIRTSRAPSPTSTSSPRYELSHSHGVD